MYLATFQKEQQRPKLISLVDISNKSYNEIQSIKQAQFNSIEVEHRNNVYFKIIN